MYTYIYIKSINLLYGGHILIAVFYYTEMYVLWKYSTTTTNYINIDYINIDYINTLKW